ncbi:hypothetical protein J6590_047335 [Homalodisca vitripennis]|nr:hypothetical protein J6590_047335 [Homalodisca vitripennis]
MDFWERQITNRKFSDIGGEGWWGSLSVKAVVSPDIRACHSLHALTGEAGDMTEINPQNPSSRISTELAPTSNLTRPYYHINSAEKEKKKVPSTQPRKFLWYKRKYQTRGELEVFRRHRTPRTSREKKDLRSFLTNLQDLVYQKGVPKVFEEHQEVLPASSRVQQERFEKRGLRPRFTRFFIFFAKTSKRKSALSRGASLKQLKPDGFAETAFNQSAKIHTPAMCGTVM